MKSYQSHRRRSPGTWTFLFCALVTGFVYFPTLGNARAQSWTLAWSDEFNGPQGLPSTTTWNFDLGNSGFGNQELETYCGPPGYPQNPQACPTTFSPTTSNAYIDGQGHLVIQAIHNTATNIWTSARMNTATSTPTTFQYGRIEAREMLPIGAGLWPAFWAYGSNIQTAGWPTCGEMDFMENVPASAGQGPTIFSATIHGPGYSGANGLSQKHTFPTGDVTSFHTYGAIWSPYMIQFYVDDPAKVFFIRTASDIPGGTQWAFNHPFILLTNLAVGGSWPGPPDNTTPNPAIMMVGYVRYYQAAPVTPPNLGNPSPITVKAGATTGNTSAVNLLSQSGSGRVYLNCTTTAPLASCSVNTGYSLNSNVADFTSTNTATATVTVTTTANSMLPPFLLDPNVRFWMPVELAALLVLARLLKKGRARRLPRWANGIVLAGVVLAAALVVGCGSGACIPNGCGTCGVECPQHNGTTPGTYTVSVNAYTVSSNGAAPDATVNIVLTVQ